MAPGSGGKTVIRAGAGIFYENAVFNNILFDQPTRLESGLFFQTSPLLCSGGLGDYVSRRRNCHLHQR